MPIFIVISPCIWLSPCLHPYECNLPSSKQRHIYIYSKRLSLNAQCEILSHTLSFLSLSLSVFSPLSLSLYLCILQVGRRHNPTLVQVAVCRNMSERCSQDLDLKIQLGPNFLTRGHPQSEVQVTHFFACGEECCEASCDKT